MKNSSRAVLLAALLFPAALLFRSEAAAETGTILTMIDRETRLFRLTNHTDKSVKLSSLFYPFLKERFAPCAVDYEFQKHGKWIDIPYPINALGHDYLLRPKKSVDFELTLDAFIFGKVPRGTLVRVKVDGTPCRPFVW